MQSHFAESEVLEIAQGELIADSYMLNTSKTGGRRLCVDCVADEILESDTKRVPVEITCYTLATLPHPWAPYPALGLSTRDRCASENMASQEAALSPRLSESAYTQKHVIGQKHRQRATCAVST